MRMIQRELQEKVRGEIMTVRERLTGVVRPLDGGKRHQRPAPTAWSVDEVLEHLCVTDGLYVPKLQKLIATAGRDAAAPNREWKSSFLGGMIAGSLEKPGKTKTLKALEPTGAPRGGVLDAFFALQHSMLDLMDQASSIDWNKARVGSPALPWFAPKMNLGDVFRLHGTHALRHMGQIERTLRILENTGTAGPRH